MAQYRTEMVREKMEHDIIYESQNYCVVKSFTQSVSYWGMISRTFLSKMFSILYKRTRRVRVIMDFMCSLGLLFPLCWGCTMTGVLKYLNCLPQVLTSSLLATTPCCHGDRCTVMKSALVWSSHVSLQALFW